MADKQRYRHAITGLVGEFEKELADVFKDVLVLVDGNEPVEPPVSDPEPDAAEGASGSEEEK